MITIDPTSLAALINERDHLARQVTELQTRGTELIQEVRHGRDERQTKVVEWGRTIPMDAKIVRREPSDYHVKELASARKKLAALQKMSLEEIEKAAGVDFNETRSRTGEYQQKNTVLRQRYLDMIERVTKWNPPSEEHTNFRKFMLDQLKESVRFDCWDEDRERFPTPKKPTPKQWFDEQLSELQRNIASHEVRIKEEEESCRRSNEWLDQLEACVPMPTKRRR